MRFQSSSSIENNNNQQELWFCNAKPYRIRMVQLRSLISKQTFWDLIQSSRMCSEYVSWVFVRLCDCESVSVTQHSAHLTLSTLICLIGFYRWFVPVPDWSHSPHCYRTIKGPSPATLSSHQLSHQFIKYFSISYWCQCLVMVYKILQIRKLL